MRPGLNVRDSSASKSKIVNCIDASMRPGLNVRDSGPAAGAGARAVAGFNEARTERPG